jgi:hypothetical protein
MGQLSDPRLSLPSAPSPALLRTASHSRWACWLLGGRRAACEAAATLRRCGSRAEPNVADQPQPLLRSEVQARWRSVVAAQTAVPPKWTAYQCPPAAIVPLQRHWRQQRLAAAVVVVTSTPSSRKEDVPDMATAPRDMDRSERLHRRAQGLEACERSSELLGAVHPRAHRQEERATGQIRCWSLVVHYNPAHDSGAGSTIFC